MNPNLQNCSKKPYQQPILRVYGDLRVLTGTSMNNGAVTDGNATKSG